DQHDAHVQHPERQYLEDQREVDGHAPDQYPVPLIRSMGHGAQDSGARAIAFRQERLQGMKLKGKVAVVMGAGSIAPGIGNGKAVALAFAREGAKVLAADISGEAVADTRDRILAAGGECEIAVADVSKEDDVRSVIDR